MQNLPHGRSFFDYAKHLTDRVAVITPRLDDEGYLYLSDRMADLIISGGVNIYPAEVEHALLELDGLTDACVVSRPDEHWGESVHAVVVTSRSGDHATLAEQLRSELRQSIAGYKVPRSIDVVDALPRSAAGKLLRREVREQVHRAWTPPDTVTADAAPSTTRSSETT